MIMAVSHQCTSRIEAHCIFIYYSTTKKAAFHLRKRVRAAASARFYWQFGGQDLSEDAQRRIPNAKDYRIPTNCKK